MVKLDKDEFNEYIFTRINNLIRDHELIKEDADQGAQQHAHGQGVEHEAVPAVLEDRVVTDGEHDLKNIGAHRGGRGNAQAIDKHRENHIEDRKSVV